MNKGVTNKQVLSRQAALAVSLGFVIDSAVHANQTLGAGLVMGKMANGKYRAYVEAVVTTAFSNAAPAFAVDPAGPLAGFLKVGDVVESVAGAALGTVATFNASTGAGTLTGNSAANLAIGQRIRVTEATLSLGAGKGRVLTSEVEVLEVDEDASGYIEGYLVKTSYTTDAAVAKFGVDLGDNEFRMKL